MQASVKLGRVWGIPIGLHSSWFLIFALVTFSLAVGFFPEEYPNLAPLSYWLLGAVTSVLFFGSVLVHELAHAWFALRERIPVRAINLFIFGGVAQIEHDPRTAGAEFRIAAAGPAASFALAGLFQAIYWLDQDISPYLAAPSLWLARINLLLALFNLIPGFPLDGGRVLRAVIWQVSGSMSRATRISSRVGQWVAFGFIGFGLLSVFMGAVFNGIWLMFIGWFLKRAAEATLAQAGFQEKLNAVNVAQLMTRDCLPISGEMSIKQLVEEQILSGRPQKCFVISDHGQPRGVLSINDVVTVSRENWAQVTAQQLMVPWEHGPHLEPGMPLLTALQIMEHARLPQLAVMQDGRLIGVLSRETILRHMGLPWGMMRPAGPHPGL